MIVGQKGERGFQGVAGIDGAPGVSGLPGMKGEPGPAGLDGLPGTRGLDGMFIHLFKLNGISQSYQYMGESFQDSWVVLDSYCSVLFLMV